MSVGSTMAFNHGDRHCKHTKTNYQFLQLTQTCTHLEEMHSKEPVTSLVLNDCMEATIKLLFHVDHMLFRSSR